MTHRVVASESDAVAPRPWAIEFLGPGVAQAYAGGGASLPPELTVEPEDACVEKSAPSALFPGRSPVDSLLQEQQIETVLICGTVTNVCVEATARDAATLGYRTIVVGDACAGVDDESHAASLRTIYRSFGDVRRVAEVEALLDAGRGRTHPPRHRLDPRDGGAAPRDRPDRS